MPDYSSKGDFNTAFRFARISKDKEFTWNGKLYSTDLISKEDNKNYIESKKYLTGYINKNSLGYTPHMRLEEPGYTSITSQKGNLKESGYYSPSENKLFIDTSDKTTALHELTHKAGLVSDTTKSNLNELSDKFFNNLGNSNNEWITKQIGGPSDLNYLLSPRERAARHVTTQNYLDSNGKGDLGFGPDTYAYLKYHYNELPSDTKQLMALYQDSDTFEKEFNKPLISESVKTRIKKYYTGGTYDFLYKQNADNQGNIIPTDPNRESLITPTTNQVNNATSQNGNNSNIFTNQQAGNAAYAVGSAFNNSVSKRYRTDSEQKADTLGTGVAGAIGPWWGALAQVGIAASTEIQGDRTNKDANIAGNIVNPFNQFANNKDGGDWAMSFLNPIKTNIDKGLRITRETDEANRIRDNKIVSDIVTNSQGVLASYPTKGVLDASFKRGGRLAYAGGGGLPNPISGGDKQQLSSDGAVYEGNTHEQGGINIGNAEIEDQEVIQNDRIYSDRLNPSEQVVTLVNQLGFKGNKKDTYASLSESLLKQKGKYEKGNDNLSIRTGEKMASRIDEVLNIVFADQQSKNNDQGMKKAYGGYVGNDPTKRKLPKDVAVSYSTTLGDNPLVKVDENDPLIYDKNEFINYYRNKTVNAFDPDTRASYDDILNKQGNENADAYLASRGGLPNFDSYQKIVRDYEKTNINNPTDWANLNSNISAPSGYRYNANFGQGLPAKGSITRKRAYGGTIPDYDPDYEAYIINNRLPINTIGGLDTAPTNFSRLTPKEQLLGDPVSLGYTNDPTLYGRSNDPLLGGPASLGYANINNNIPNPNVPSVPNITGNDNTNSSTSSNRRRGYNSDLYNLVGTGVNQSIIDRMKTETPARTVLEPGFSYTDMSSPAYNKNTRNFREAVLTARKYGSLTPGTVSNLYASKIENDANIAANESARRQGAVEGYQNRTQQARQYNSGVLSQNDFYNTQRHNEKLGLTQGNINNFIQGAIGNETVRNQTSLDRDRALITSTLEGNRGITKRQLTSNPQLKEAYTRMFGEEYVKRILEQ